MIADIIIIAVVAVLFGLCLRKLILEMKKGGCSGCSGNCASCGSQCQSNQKKS